MIQIAPQMRILVAVEAVDGRKGIDAIAQLCREKLNADPFSGYLFIFRTRRGTAIRVLQYDGQGFWLATKRLSALRKNSEKRAIGGDLSVLLFPGFPAPGPSR
jgi:transposase